MIVAAEDVVDRIAGGFIGGELLRPRHAAVNVERLAIQIGAGELGVARVLLGMLVRLVLQVPWVPAFGLDVRAHLRADERDARLAPAIPLPWSAEEGGRAFAGQRAVEEDVAELLFRRRARGRHIAAVLAVNRAVLEHRRRATEDEIDAALDVTIREVLPPRIGAERVLPAKQSTIADDRAVAV